MHILMVAPEQIPVPGGGSVEICMLAIAKQLAKRHRVTIVSRRSSHLKNSSRDGNLTIVRVPSGKSGRYIASVLNYIKGKHYDFIQVDNRPHYMAKVKAIFPRTPVSLFLHSLTFVPRTKAVAASMQKADLIIANSGSLKLNLSRMFPTQRHKIRTVHLGVDVSRFRPPTVAMKLQCKQRLNLGRSFTILFAGRVIPRKGVDVLIRAVREVRKQIPKAKLIIAGQGRIDYIQKLKALAQSQRVPARFIGRIAHGKIHGIYQAADCFVCPSQKHEAFGLVNVEALASGVPVVASNIGGIHEIVRHGRNGFLIGGYSNPNAFAAHIVKIAKNPSLAVQMGKQGRETAVSRFCWSNTAAKLARIYLKIS